MSEYVLRHRETQAEIKTGDHITHRETWQVWRFEGIVIPAESSQHFGQFLIRVSAYSAQFRRRVSRLLHPHLFLCEIQMVMEEVAETVVHWTKVWGLTKEQLVIPLWLGAIAWVFLAFADKLKLEDLLFNWIH